MIAAFGASAAALRALAGLDIGYRIKVASSPESLPRRDGLVVYVDGGRPEVAGRIASAMEPVPGLGCEASLFAKPVAPGVAIAWEPADPRPEMHGLSFGEHRSAVLAGALIKHAGRADADTSSVTSVLAAEFAAAGIDPADPACSLG